MESKPFTRTMYHAHIEQQSRIKTTDITEITRLYQKDFRKSICVTLAIKFWIPFQVSDVGNWKTPDVVIADSTFKELNRIICHYACTSLDDVARSWINAITTTSTKNTTAFAWPIPFHAGPLRP